MGILGARTPSLDAIPSLLFVDVGTAKPKNLLKVRRGILASCGIEHIHAFTPGEGCPTQESLGKRLVRDDRLVILLQILAPQALESGYLEDPTAHNFGLTSKNRL